MREPFGNSCHFEISVWTIMTHPQWQWTWMDLCRCITKLPTSESDVIYFSMYYNTVYYNTVNQLLFTCEKFLRGVREPRRSEYFSPRWRLVIIKKRVWKWLDREIWLSRNTLAWVNHEIKSSRIKVGLQYFWKINIWSSSIWGQVKTPCIAPWISTADKTPQRTYLQYMYMTDFLL